MAKVTFDEHLRRRQHDARIVVRLLLPRGRFAADEVLVRLPQVS